MLHQKGFQPKMSHALQFCHSNPLLENQFGRKMKEEKKRSYVLLINNAQNVKQVMSNQVVAYKLQMEFQDLSNIHIYFFCCGVFILGLFRINYIRRGGFQLVDLIITELKDHMNCYKFECSHWWKIYLSKEILPLQYLLSSLNAVISTNERS